MTPACAIPGSEQIVGVLLAAGRGRRMGGSKQLTTVQTDEGPKPLVAASFDAIGPACREVVVVLGHRAEEVAAALGPRAFHRACSDPDAEMLDSVGAGLGVVRTLGARRGVLLHPADHPAVSVQTLRTILAAHADYPGIVIIPSFDDRGGHPTLIPQSLCDRIGSLSESGFEGGLRAFWEDHPELVLRVGCPDPGIIRDIDVPGDIA